MKAKNDNPTVVPNHLEEERLIAYLDGELDIDAQNETRGHLLSCWDCRARLSSVERSIENFLHFRHTTLLPRELPPSGLAVENFRRRLTARQARTSSPSLLRILDFRSLLRRIFNSLNPARYSLRAQVIVARAAATVVLLGIIAAFALFSGRLNAVSASEVLRLASESQAVELSATSQPVLYERLKVRMTLAEKTSRAAAARTQSSEAVNEATWEIWRDHANSRAKFASFEGGSKTASPSTPINDIQFALRSNRMDDLQPLSAGSYRAWSDSLISKSEEVTKQNDEKGVSILKITTTPNREIKVGDIAEGRFSVRAADYHPTSLYLRIKGIQGDQEFELFEERFEVVSLSSLPANFFAGSASDTPPGTISTSRADQPPTSAEEPATSPAAGDANSTSETAGASLETEVEVFKQLDSVNALSGDQITVSRIANRQLKIVGIVDSTQRKQEIINALSAFRSDRGVIIDIQTSAEAARRTRQARSNSNISVENVAVDTETALPVEAELRAALAKRGISADGMEKELRTEAASVIAGSHQLRRDALALKQIAERFTPAEVNRLEAAKREEWKALIRSRAHAVSSDVRTLTSRLAAVIPTISAGSASGGVDLTSVEGISSGAQRLFGLAAACDAQVSQSFTISTGSKVTPAVRSIQFWRNLAQMSVIAADLEKY